MGTSWALGYYLVSLAALLFFWPLSHAYAETNLPPLGTPFRTSINFVFLNLLLSYFFLWKQRYRFTLSFKWLWVFIGLGVLLCLMPPIFSGDVYEYLIRGRILALYGQSPYAHVPLEFPQDLLYSKCIWKTFPFDYGPGLLYLLIPSVCLGEHSIAVSLFLYKLMLLPALTLLGAVFQKLSAIVDARECSNDGFLLAANPLFVVMTLIDGHNDVLMIGLSLWAVYFLEKKNYERAFLCWTLAFLFKYSVILILPFLLVRVLREERDRTQGFPWKALFVNLTLNGALILTAYGPVWGGWENHLVLFSYARWFYTNSIPYLLWASLKSAGIPVEQSWVANAALGLFVAFFVLATLSLAFRKRVDGRFFYGALAGAYLMFLFQMTAPLQAWYLLWVLPWLCLLRLPAKVLLSVLLTSVGLYAYGKRINFLLIAAGCVYGGYLLFKSKFNWRRLGPSD